MGRCRQSIDPEAASEQVYYTQDSCRLKVLLDSRPCSHKDVFPVWYYPKNELFDGGGGNESKTKSNGK